MNYSNDGLRLTEQFEGCKLVAYQDQGGIWTIGYGHTKGVYDGMTCTTEQAEKWLRLDVEEAEEDVSRLVKVPLTQPQFDALVDFVFNLGGTKFASSTLLRLINAGNFKYASKEFERWNRAGGIVRDGLTRRRLAEKDLFLQGTS
jgi:lysozyme